MTLQASEIRQDFPLLRQNPDLKYLDNAATSQKPESVLKAINSFYRSSNANVGRSNHELAVQATKEYRAARETVSGFFGTSPDNLVFTSGTTHSINLVAEALQFDGKAVFPETAHHSLQLPFRKNGRAELIPVNNGTIDLDTAKEMIDGDTDVVGASQISNLTGNRQSTEELARVAHENDALFLLDAAQSAPRIPISFDDHSADFLVFSGHKMLGPMGVGGLLADPEVQEDLMPPEVGGGMVTKVTSQDSEFRGFPKGFEAGTPNVSGASGLAEAVRYLHETSLKEIESHEKKFVKKIHAALKHDEDVRMLGSESSDRFIASLGFKDIHPHDAAEVFEQHNIAVRAGLHCVHPFFEERSLQGTVRISPYLYNPLKEAEEVLDAVEEVKEVFRF